MAFFLGFFLPQLLTRGLLVLLNEIAGDHIHDRVLSAGDTRKQQRGSGRKPQETLVHVIVLK
jgi:hypothetical protein